MVSGGTTLAVAAAETAPGTTLCHVFAALLLLLSSLCFLLLSRSCWSWLRFLSLLLLLFAGFLRPFLLRCLLGDMMVVKSSSEEKAGEENMIILDCCWLANQQGVCVGLFLRGVVVRTHYYE